MGFIIKRNEDGKYVAVSGLSSYTRDIRKAKQFKTREAAESDCCGNEHVVRLEHELAG